MVRKKELTSKSSKTPSIRGVIEGAGQIVEQKIVNTIEQNYMPYAMSVTRSTRWMF